MPDGKDEGELRKDFLALPWHKRIHPDIELEELDGTLKMIEDLYKSVQSTTAPSSKHPLEPTPNLEGAGGTRV
jgi:hypothetical protein